MRRRNYTFESSPETAALIRGTVDELLRAAMPAQELRDLMVGVGEAVANAIQHARGPLRVDVELTECEAAVTISDCGGGLDLERLRTADVTAPLDAESGRGLYIMRQMCDSVVVDQGRGCTVTITKSFGPGEPHGTRPPG